MKLRYILVIVIIIGITGCKTPLGSSGSTFSDPVTDSAPEASDISASQGSDIHIATKNVYLEPVISITTETKEVSASDKLLFEVKADNVSDLFAASFSISYDTTLLKFDEAIEGTFLNRNNADRTVFLYFNNTAKGRIDVGLTRLGQTSLVSGSGVLMTFEFEAIAEGTADIDFSDEYVKGGNGSGLETIPLDFIGTEVCVK